MEVSHFRLFLTPGIDFLGKNTSEMVYLKTFEKNFFLDRKCGIVKTKNAVKCGKDVF